MLFNFKQIRTILIVGALIFGLISQVAADEAIKENSLPGSSQLQIGEWVETVLEKVLEAGQLLYIQFKNIVDPDDVGLTSALKKHFQTLQENPLLMTGVGLALVGIPFVIIRSVQTRRRRQQELDELKESLDEEEFYEDDEDEEEEDYDYEEEMGKLREDKDEEEEETGEDYDYEEEMEELRDEEEQEIATEEEVEEFLEEPPPAQTSVSQKESRSEDLNLQNKSISELSSEDSDDVIKRLEQQFAILEDEFQDTDEIREEADIDDSSEAVAPTPSAFEGELKLDEKEDSKVDDATFGSQFEEDEDSDDDFNKLKEEMERTIQELSEQIVDESDYSPNTLKGRSSTSENTEDFDQLFETSSSADETLLDEAEVQMESDESATSSDEDLTMSVEDILGTEDKSRSDSSSELDPAPDEEHIQLAKELLKEQKENLSSEMEELETVGVEAPAEEESDETLSSKEEDEEYSKMTADLLNELDSITSGSEEPEGTHEKAPDLPTLEEPSQKITEPASSEVSTSDIDDRLSFLTEDSSQPTSHSLPPLDYQDRIAPEKADNYINRLEIFQKKLESRLKNLDPANSLEIESEDFREDFYAPDPSPSYDKFHWEETDNYQSAKLNFERKKPEMKKAYSLELLESFILLENQKGDLK